MSHRYHPSDDDPSDAILWDDCADCQAHVRDNGLRLDGPSFARAWNRMLDVEFRNDSYRTANEAAICGQFYRMGLLMSRHSIGGDPWLRLDAEEEA